MWSRARSLFVRRLEPGLFVRRRQSAGVGVGAFGCGSMSVEETRAARIRGADGTKGSLSFVSFSFGVVCVCVCREASSASRNRVSCPCVA